MCAFRILKDKAGHPGGKTVRLVCSINEIGVHIRTYIHTNLYSAKNRENESEVLAQDD